MENIKLIHVFSLLIIVLFSSVVFSTQPALAQPDLSGQINAQINAGAKTAGVGAAKDPQEIIAEVIKVILSILGVFFMTLVLLAGYWYVTAKGEEDKVEKAKDTIQAAIIGLTIIMMAYAITLFVTTRFKAAVKEGGTTNQSDILQPGAEGWDDARS